MYLKVNRMKKEWGRVKKTGLGNLHSTTIQICT